MDELEVIEKFGVVTAPEIAHILGKTRESASRSLQFYLKINEIKKVEVRLKPRGKTFFYLINGLYEDLFED